VSARVTPSRDVVACGLVLLSALVVRFPYFFPAVINWDEGAFILVGQSLLDGHLPYVERFALKPPLAFAFYAGVIAVSGRSLVGIRLAGALCIAATACLLYVILRHSWSRRVALTAALLSVATTSVLPGGQATMTEHVALVPLVGALWVLTRSEPSAGTSFVAGVLLALATLVRLNLAYAVVLLGLFVLLAPLKRAPLTGIRHALAYAGGGGVVVALTWLPYALGGQQALLWTSAVVAPLAHAHSHPSVFLNLKLQSMQALGLYHDRQGFRFRGSVLVTSVLLAALGGAAIIARGGRAAASNRGVLLLVLFTVGVGVAIVKAGPPHSSHTLLLAPFAAAFAAVFVDRLARRARLSTLALVGALVLISLSPIVDGYRAVVSRTLAHEPLRSGAAYEIADYLKRENVAHRPVYLMTDHIAYWLGDSPPPTRLTTHPATISQQFLLDALVGQGASTEEELRKVYRQRPEFIVMHPGWSREGEARQWLKQTLDDDYVVATRIQGRTVYRRKAG
jgi:4-amino-4-deoxy-L-arabinose transferase-like glycosyltransferase